MERFVSMGGGTCRNSLDDELVDLFEGSRPSSRVLEVIGRIDWDREVRIDEKVSEFERFRSLGGVGGGDEVMECEYRPRAGPGRWFCCIETERSKSECIEFDCSVVRLAWIPMRPR